MYMQTTGKEVPIKWWTFVEWVLSHQDNPQPINPLPYLWNNDISKYAQSFLFRGCLDFDMNEDLCSISSIEYKKFKVFALSGTWSDGSPITLDDIYFTYNDVIKNNKFELDSTSIYSALEVEREDGYISVEFPVGTINNSHFFTFPILPVSKLWFVDRNWYSTNYLTEFINSTCTKIHDSSDMKNNFILDFTNCEDYWIKNYQFKMLGTSSEILNYTTWNVLQIDLYKWLSNVDDTKFVENKVFIDDYYVLFYNHDGSLTVDQKRNFVSLSFKKTCRE